MIRTTAESEARTGTSSRVAPEPVNPSITPEARVLLERLYEISGTNTFTGQHNTPRELSQYSDEAETITGHYPAIWGQDFGFSEDGDMDGVNFRPDIVDEAKRQHAAGSIITLMWHAVRPTEEEPVTFDGSICDGPLADDDWRDLLTPGTETHTRWMRQVDVIAALLAELRDARIPVLWRPYHEMNGSWFWWGGRPGDNGYAALYRQLFDRLVNVHELNNLVWVWNANGLRGEVKPYADLYPGHDVVDVLATDIYGNDYSAKSYDDLLELAEGRPMGLGEVGVLPTPEIIESQPRWAWFMTWTNFLSRENPPEAVRTLFEMPRMLHCGE